MVQEAVGALPVLLCRSSSLPQHGAGANVRRSTCVFTVVLLARAARVGHADVHQQGTVSREAVEQHVHKLAPRYTTG